MVARGVKNSRARTIRRRSLWLSTAAVYADLAKPLAEQSMKIRYEPVRPETGQDLYGAWRQRQADQSRH